MPTTQRTQRQPQVFGKVEIMTPYFPGLPQMQDARFIDAAGNIATMLDILMAADGGMFVIAKCQTEGKIFCLTLDRWNEIYVAIDSKEYRDSIHKKVIQKDNKT
jgi:hypothetical protein